MFALLVVFVMVCSCYCMWFVCLLCVGGCFAVWFVVTSDYFGFGSCVVAVVGDLVSCFAVVMI